MNAPIETIFQVERVVAGAVARNGIGGKATSSNPTPRLDLRLPLHPRLRDLHGGAVRSSRAPVMLKLEQGLEHPAREEIKTSRALGD
jgi:hypothetical protein